MATGRGDDGTTGLLFGGERVFKDDPRTEAYGAIDEAVAALGLARAELAMKAQYGTLPRVLDRMPELILRFQRELFVAAAQMATAPGAADRQKAGETRISAEMVASLDKLLARDRGGDRAAPRVRRPGGDAPVGGTRAGADHRAPSRTAGRLDPPFRPAPRRPAGALPEPPRRPALDLRPRCGTGRVPGLYTIADPPSRLTGVPPGGP